MGYKCPGIYVGINADDRLGFTEYLSLEILPRYKGSAMLFCLAGPCKPSSWQTKTKSLKSIGRAGIGSGPGLQQHPYGR
jgi:hypothetical protein